MGVNDWVGDDMNGGVPDTWDDGTDMSGITVDESPVLDPGRFGWGSDNPIQGQFIPPATVLPPGGASSIGNGGSGGGNWFSKLLGGLGSRSNGLGDAASVLGGMSSGAKADRIIKGGFTQNYDRLMMDAQRDRNTNEADAMKKLQQTSYLLGGGSQFKPPILSLGGKTYNSPDLGFGPVKVSDAEKAGANTLQGQLFARLMPGGSYTPQPLSGYADPGKMERIGSYGALATGGLGTLGTIMNGDTPVQVGQNSGGSGTMGKVNTTMGAVNTGLKAADTVRGIMSFFHGGGD